MKLKKYIVKIVTEKEKFQIIVDAIDKKSAIRKVKYVLDNSSLFNLKNKDFKLYSFLWKGD